jgi:hypothetical protein
VPTAVTSEEFDTALEEILTDWTGAQLMIEVPGVYELLAEHFNNEALKLVWAKNQPESNED